MAPVGLSIAAPAYAQTTKSTFTNSTVNTIPSSGSVGRDLPVKHHGVGCDARVVVKRDTAAEDDQSAPMFTECRLVTLTTTMETMVRIARIESELPLTTKQEEAVRKVIHMMTAGQEQIAVDDLPPCRVTVHVLSKKGSTSAVVIIEPDGAGGIRVKFDHAAGSPKTVH